MYWGSAADGGETHEKCIHKFNYKFSSALSHCSTAIPNFVRRPPSAAWPTIRNRCIYFSKYTMRAKTGVAILHVALRRQKPTRKDIQTSIVNANQAPQIQAPFDLKENSFFLPTIAPVRIGVCTNLHFFVANQNSKEQNGNKKSGKKNFFILLSPTDSAHVRGARMGFPHRNALAKLEIHQALAGGSGRGGLA